MNDLKWNQEMIPWQEFLNLLGVRVFTWLQKNPHYAMDTLITDDVSIFATVIVPIMFSGKSANVEGENAMMDEVSAVFSDSIV